MQVFPENTLKELDASAYEEAPALGHEEAMQGMERHGTASLRDRTTSIDSPRRTLGTVTAPKVGFAVHIVQRNAIGHAQ